MTYTPINFQHKFGDFVWHVPNTGEEGGERTAQNDVWILRGARPARKECAGRQGVYPMVFAWGPAVGRRGGLFKGKQQQRSIMQRLDAERESYLAIYLRAISEARRAHDVTVAEVKVETTREKLRKPYRYYTLDIFCRRGDKSGPIEVNIAAASAFPRVREHWQGLDVTLHPFVWNGLEFRLDGDLADEAGLLAWMDKWMDLPERKPKDENRLSQIVHNVTQPERTKSGWSFSVDFGSAPLDAFVELIDVVRASGTKRLELGSFGYPRG